MAAEILLKREVYMEDSLPKQ